MHGGYTGPARAHEPPAQPSAPFRRGKINSAGKIVRKCSVVIPARRLLCFCSRRPFGGPVVCCVSPRFSGTLRGRTEYRKCGKRKGWRHVDGVWDSQLLCAEHVVLPPLSRVGKHTLTVYVKQTIQVKRWGTPGESGKNVVRVLGLQVAKGSRPLMALPRPKWGLIVGDSITEGCGATELQGYSHLIGQALRTQGYEYAISACGWSGWINRGDRPPGDVPGYYVVTGSRNGMGGTYDQNASRWNRIDANHSLLDAAGRISAYGKTNQEPSLILINYGTNDVLHKANPSDVVASMAQCLTALRKAAPAAQIVLLVPFGQYKADEIKQVVANYLNAHPEDKKVSIIDLGTDAAAALRVKNGYWGGLHPNPRAHAAFAARLIPQLMPFLPQAMPATREAIPGD